MRPRHVDGRVPADCLAPPQGSARRRCADVRATRNLGLVPHRSRLQGSGVHASRVVCSCGPGVQSPNLITSQGSRMPTLPWIDLPRASRRASRTCRTDVVRRIVRDSYTALARSAKVSAHLLTLTERFARQRLADTTRPCWRQAAGAVRVRRERWPVPARRRTGRPIRGRQGRGEIGGLDAWRRRSRGCAPRPRRARSQATSHSPSR